MRKFSIFIIFIFSCLFCVDIFSGAVSAISSNLVFSQVQTRSLTSDSAYEELIEIYNNSDNDVDISNWLLQYGTSGDLKPTKTLVTFNTISANSRLYLTKRSAMLLLSKSSIADYPKFGYDFSFSSGLADNQRWLSLVDESGNTVDLVEWSELVNSLTAEGGRAAIIPTSSYLIQRKLISPGILQDSDNNYDDFEIATARTVYGYGAIYEKADSLPDLCPNIDGVQSIVPDGYELDNGQNCVLSLLPLKITEILPNPDGYDAENEFIEIYNPNDSAVDLKNYRLGIGYDDIKKYSLPDNLTIAANEYLAFYNRDIKFTLLNTTGSAQIWSEDGSLIDNVNYSSPKSGESWALINNMWQYTNQITPSALNLSSVDINDDLEESNLVACAANQYRNPETGRCKLIASTTNLVPCKDGQYRSEETNRCRNIASDVTSLVPCAEGQERNPKTNRCRSVSAVLGTNLAPCKEGQERNPKTNRCRKIVSTKIPLADYAPEQTAESSNNYVLWWSLTGVVVVAIAYGVWEWRQEIGRLFRKIKKIIIQFKNQKYDR